MSRIYFCKACANEKNGVKTRIAVEHTCDREHSANVLVIKSVCKYGSGSHVFDGFACCALCGKLRSDW